MNICLRGAPVCFIATLLLSGCASRPHPSDWEYKVVEAYQYSGKLEPRLNELAQEGWIVVSASTSIHSEGGNPMTQVILKRNKRR